MLITGDSTKNATLYVAAYTQEGHMLTVVSKDITAAQIADGSIAIDLDTSGAAYVSAFLLESDGSMVPMAPKKTQTVN